MTRIFSALSLFTVTLWIANIMIGMMGGDYNGVSRQLYECQEDINQLLNERKFDRDRVEALEQRDRVGALEQRRAKLLEQLVPIKQYTTLHILVGVLAALVAILVNSISVTYFIGTSRWCKEVSHAYDLGQTHFVRCKTIKARCFPWSLLGILTAMSIVALGAAADPGTLRRGTADWVTFHSTTAIVGTVAIAVSLLMQTQRLRENYQVIESVLQEVNRIRDRSAAGRLT